MTNATHGCQWARKVRGTQSKKKVPNLTLESFHFFLQLVLVIFLMVRKQQQHRILFICTSISMEVWRTYRQTYISNLNSQYFPSAEKLLRSLEPQYQWTNLAPIFNGDRPRYYSCADQEIVCHYLVHRGPTNSAYQNATPIEMYTIHPAKWQNRFVHHRYWLFHNSNTFRKFNSNQYHLHVWYW